MDFISIDEIRVGDEVGVVRPLPNGFCRSDRS